MTPKNIYTLLLLLIIISGCNDNTPDISGIEIENISVKRYDQDLFNINQSNIGKSLKELSGNYHLFIGDHYRDTLNIIQIYQYVNDPLLLDLYKVSQEVYPDLNILNKELTEAFKYNKYYFPSKNIPDFYSYISGVDAEYPVAIMDSSVIIGIDCFLGKDFVIYKQMRIPMYKARRMRPEYIKVAVMDAYSRSEFVSRRPGEQLIDKMIEEGKILYYLDRVLPDVHDTLKIGYTKDQLNWCDDNEANLWAFLMENELLFSSDLQKINKLVQDGPFTSYFSNESPGKIAHWIGWQIVRSYMDNNNVMLDALMKNHDNQLILNKSAYKP